MIGKRINAVVDGRAAPFDFAQSNYTRHTVNSTTGIAGFSLRPFGGELNVSFDNLLAITASPVPEPGTWLTMLLGFGVIGSTLRRRAALRATAAA